MMFIYVIAVPIRSCLYGQMLCVEFLNSCCCILMYILPKHFLSEMYK